MKEVCKNILKQCVEGLQRKGSWSSFEVPEISVEYPGDAENGDVASNIAMKLTKLVGKKPLDIASDIKAFYDDGQNFDTQKRIGEMDVAAPGFLNFTFSEAYLTENLHALTQNPKDFGKNNLGAGKKLLLEFISANPTGPLTLANGRGGFVGDTLARVFQASGYNVTKEYYVNDVGNQIDVLAESVARRYLQEHGVTVDYPDHLYKGEYIRDLAEQMKFEITKDFLHTPDALEKMKAEIKPKALEQMLAEIQRVVKDVMRVEFDEWFRESSLYKNFDVQKFLEELKEKDIAYEKDGAVWLRTTAHGDDKDRVIVKASGEQTYFLSDILYQRKRFGEQKFEEKILILGADHHGYVKRVEAIAAALGYPGKLKVMLMQLVKLMKEGKEVRMSKRKGTFVTIEEVIEEIGVDVARFFFLMYGSDTHMTLDIDQAKEKSEKNPVYYVQYAYARIRSIEREMEKRQEQNTLKTQEEGFTHESEMALVKELLKFPGVVEEVSRSHATQHLPVYAMSVAKHFHAFYGNCRVIEENIFHATRGKILEATKIVLEKTLGLMGIGAPESMVKEEK